jgi:hypothetical protein
MNTFVANLLITLDTFGCNLLIVINIFLAAKIQISIETSKYLSRKMQKSG